MPFYNIITHMGYTPAPHAVRTPDAPRPILLSILATCGKDLPQGQNPPIFSSGRLAGISIANPARAERQQP